MSGIKRLRLAGCVVMAALCVLPIVGVAKPRAWNEGGTASEELRSLMKAALSAARDGDQAKLKEIAHGMMIPNHEAWFKITFGKEDGAKMAVAYKKGFEWQEDWIPKLFEGLSKHEGEWLVEEVREPKVPGILRCEQVLADAGRKGTAFYLVTFQMDINGGPKVDSPAGFYTFVEGAYRRLDCVGMGLGLQGGVASGRPSSGPIGVRGNIQAARIINRVQPVYPQEARKKGIAGIVRLHVLLAKDGTVKQMELVSGHPLLQQAAIDAVRQWTYHPTLLNGEPVEIDTTIDIFFVLNSAPAKSP